MTQTVEAKIVGIRDHILMSNTLKGKIGSIKPPNEGSLINIFFGPREEPKIESFERVSYEETKEFQSVTFEVPVNRMNVLEAGLNREFIRLEVIVGSAKIHIGDEFFVSFDDCGPNIGFRVSVKVPR